MNGGTVFIDGHRYCVLADSLDWIEHHEALAHIGHLDATRLAHVYHAVRLQIRRRKAEVVRINRDRALAS